MVRESRLVAGWLIVRLFLVLATVVSPGCRNGCHEKRRHVPVENIDKIETSAIGDVQVGRELVRFYVAYGYDAAVLGFSVSIGTGPVRYFPIYASTNRGIPAVVLDVFASKSGDAMWVRSSWPDSEILAYYRVGSETALTSWGDMRAIEKPMPDHLSGGPLPFPEPPSGTAVRKATFKYDPEHGDIPRSW
jgi:hypothetical protein